MRRPRPPKKARCSSIRSPNRYECFPERKWFLFLHHFAFYHADAFLVFCATFPDEPLKQKRHQTYWSAHALAEIKKLNRAGYDIKAAIASRTDHPDWAQICLEHLVASDGTALAECFDKNLIEISFNDKTHHFQRLHRKTHIPYENMVFFDNEEWNIRQVKQLGVKCIYTPDGMMREHWDQLKTIFHISQGASSTHVLLGSALAGHTPQISNDR